MSSRLTPSQIQERTPVWFAMSRLWLDTELSEKELENIAKTMVASGYSLTELRIMCDSEIAPVINKKQGASEWENYDEAWLAQQIITE